MKNTWVFAILMLVFSIGATLADENSDKVSDLIGKAHKDFPEELADAVSQKIVEDLERTRKISSNRSIATLFLADFFYNRLDTGSFEGAPTVTWNGFDDANKRPTFIYKPGSFAYVTSDGRRISPAIMDTDGGSIPKILHSIGSFTPWDYGPAFIIHDWIFVAHKCDIDPDNSITFDDSALVMAEAIKTLMEVGFTDADGDIKFFPKAEDTLYLMYQAVSSSIAKGLWDDVANVRCR